MGEIGIYADLVERAGHVPVAQDLLGCVLLVAVLLDVLAVGRDAHVQLR